VRVRDLPQTKHMARYLAHMYLIENIKNFLKNQIAMIIFQIVLKIIFTNIDIFKIKPKNKIKKILKIFLDVK
jgi:hypothetical protein